MITPIKTKTEFFDLHQIREPKTGTWTCSYCNSAGTPIQVLYDPYDPNEQRKLTVPTEIIRNTSSEGEIIKINQVIAKTNKWMNIVGVKSNSDENSNMGMESAWQSNLISNVYFMEVILLFRRGPALTFTPTRTNQEMLLQLESYIIGGSLVELGTIQSSPSFTTTPNMSEATSFHNSSLLNTVPFYISPGDAIYGYLKPFISANPFGIASQAVCSLKINTQTYKDIIIN